jgi:hypothetical protein
MSTSTSIPSIQRTYRHDDWGAVSLAVFLIVVGGFWLAYPNLWNDIGRFFSSLRPLRVEGVPLFVEPTGNHSFLYGIATQFFLVMSFWLFALVAIRLYQHGDRRLISQNLTSAVFLFGLAIFSWQLQTGAILFRSIVPLVVVLLGATLVVRGLWNIFLVKTNV